MLIVTHDSKTVAAGRPWSLHLEQMGNALKNCIELNQMKPSQLGDVQSKIQIILLKVSACLGQAIPVIPIYAFLPRFKPQLPIRRPLFPNGIREEHSYVSFVEHCGIKMALNVPQVKRNPERQVGSCSSCYVLVEGSPSIFKGVSDLVRGVGCSQSDTSWQQQHPLTKHFTMLGILLVAILNYLPVSQKMKENW